MEFEFDKEMDALLRKAAGRAVLVGDDAKSHLDADTIAAFAENALPVKSRTIYTQHLAACDPCRMSLASLISINAAAEPAMAAAAAPMPVLSVPWYRKLFQAPNLAYVMGGLVLIFGGLFGLILLQNTYRSDNATLSKVVDEPQASQSAPAQAEGANSLYSANAATNTTVNAPGEIPRNVGVADTGEQPQDVTVASGSGAVPPAIAGDTTTAAAPTKDASLDGVDKAKSAQTQPAPMNAPKREEDAQEKKEFRLAAAEQENRKQDQTAAGNVYNQQQQNNQMTPNSASKVMGPSRNAIQRDNRAYDDSKMRTQTESGAGARSNEAAPAVRRAGGKTFELKQGAWYDSAYSGQKTKNIRRSSEDYRKLDGGIRSIADNIGGTVVIVWNGKAYRIQ
jgi:hypothetical protein